MFSYVFDQIPLDLRNQGHSKVFVGHSYSDQRSTDLRGAIRRAFEPELTPYFADKELRTVHILTKVAQLIAVSRLVLLDLSQFNPNVMIELGLALGLNKRILLCCHTKYDIPDFLQGIGIIRYHDYTQLSAIVENQKYHINTAIASHKISWCQLCQQQCNGRKELRYPKNCSLIIDDAPDAGHQEDFKDSLCQVFESVGVTHLTLDTAKQSQMRLLCSYTHSIRRCKFTVFRFVRGMSPLVPFLFGLSFGLRVHPVLLVERDPQIVPSDLGGYSWIEYQNFVSLQKALLEQLPTFLDRINDSISLENLTAKFDTKAREAIGNIQTILSQRGLRFEDRLQAALVLSLYAVKSRAGSLMLREGARLRIWAMAAPKIEMDEVGNWNAFDISEGICGKVTREQKSYRTGNIHEDSYYKKSTFDRHLMSLCAIPIVYENKVLGVLNADSREQDFFDDIDIEILETASRLLAPIIFRDKVIASNDEPSDSTHVQSQLARDPICQKCNKHPIALIFRHLGGDYGDDEGLRYRMISKCTDTNCDHEEEIRTYMLHSH